MPANRLLASLPRSELVPVSLAAGDVLYEPGAPIRQVYFPGGALVSLMVVDRRSALEVAVVGREGMVGIPLALGIGSSPVRALVQGGGDALRMSAASFRRAFGASARLQRGLHRYAHALTAQIAQSAACNRFHVVEARLARWLLVRRDRTGSGKFHVTHEFLAYLLGVRREGVTGAAAALHRRGLIGYRRGDVRIIDRAGLEAVACGCYEAPAARVRQRTDAGRGGAQPAA